MNTIVLEGRGIELFVAPHLDKTEFERAFRVIQPGLFRYARSLARDRDLAEDLVQEAALRAWRARGRFVVGTSFRAWLYHILRNCFLSYIRKNRSARSTRETDGVPEVPVGPNQEVAVTLGDVKRKWRHLTRDQQRSLTLVAIDGRSYEEAALLEQVPEGTVKSRVARGRQMLQALLESSEPQITPTLHAAVAATAVNEPGARSAMSECDRLQVELLRAGREQRARQRSGAIS